MPSDEIKLTRMPKDTTCHDCKIKMGFGTWGHYHKDNDLALCLDCGSKRGFESKEIVKNIIKKLELQNDIKALNANRKVYANALALMKEKMDLHRLGEHDKELEGQIVNLMAIVHDYISKVAGPAEKAAFQNLLEKIDEAKQTQKLIRRIIRDRYFLLEREIKENELPQIENESEQENPQEI